MGPQVDAFNPFAPDMLQFADGDMEPGQFMLHSNPHFMHPQTDSRMHQNSATLPDHLRNNAQSNGPQTNVDRQQRTQENNPNFMDMLIQQKLMDAMEEMRHVSRFSKPGFHISISKLQHIWRKWIKCINLRPHKKHI
jgi:hypothetical protein